MRKDKKVTIDDLAVMVNKGFQQVDKRFDKVEKKIEVNAQKIDLNAKKIDNLTARFDILEKEVRAIRSQLSKNLSIQEVFELEKRITVIEEKLGIKY